MGCFCGTYNHFHKIVWDSIRWFFASLSGVVRYLLYLSVYRIYSTYDLLSGRTQRLLTTTIRFYPITFYSTHLQIISFYDCQCTFLLFLFSCLIASCTWLFAVSPCIPSENLNVNNFLELVSENS